MNIQDMPTDAALQIVERQQNIQKNSHHSKPEWQKASKMLGILFPLLAERQAQGDPLL